MKDSLTNSHTPTVVTAMQGAITAHWENFGVQCLAQGHLFGLVDGLAVMQSLCQALWREGAQLGMRRARNMHVQCSSTGHPNAPPLVFSIPFFFFLQLELGKTKSKQD